MLNAAITIERIICQNRYDAVIQGELNRFYQTIETIY